MCSWKFSDKIDLLLDDCLVIILLADVLIVANYVPPIHVATALECSYFFASQMNRNIRSINFDLLLRLWLAAIIISAGTYGLTLFIAVRCGLEVWLIV